MRFDPTDLLLLLISIEAIAALVASGYIVHVYRQRPKDRPVSPLYRDVVLMDVLKTVVGLLLLLPASAAFFDLPRLPYTVPLVGAVILVLLAPPIVHAWRFWKLRQRGREPGTTDAMEPPPTMEIDTDG